MCKFSPDGEYMAVASEDSCVYLYSTAEDYESIGKCRRHTGPVRRFDFSDDSKYLQTSGDDQELFFFNAGTAQTMGNLSAMKDVKFPGQSVVYGWSTAGAFPKVDNGTTITATARSFSGNILCAVLYLLFCISVGCLRLLHVCIFRCFISNLQGGQLW